MNKIQELKRLIELIEQRSFDCGMYSGMGMHKLGQDSAKQRNECRKQILDIIAEWGEPKYSCNLCKATSGCYCLSLNSKPYVNSQQEHSDYEKKDHFREVTKMVFDDKLVEVVARAIIGKNDPFRDPDTVLHPSRITYRDKNFMWETYTEEAKAAIVTIRAYDAVQSHIMRQSLAAIAGYANHKGRIMTSSLEPIAYTLGRYFRVKNREALLKISEAIITQWLDGLDVEEVARASCDYTGFTYEGDEMLVEAIIAHLKTRAAGKEE